jgi:hypothetical protein
MGKCFIYLFKKSMVLTELSVTEFNVAQQHYAKTTFIEFYPKR